MADDVTTRARELLDDHPHCWSRGSAIEGEGCAYELAVAEMVAEVERLRADNERLFRGYLSIQGIPDDQIEAEIIRRRDGAS